MRYCLDKGGSERDAGSIILYLFLAMKTQDIYIDLSIFYIIIYLFNLFIKVAHEILHSLFQFFSRRPGIGIFFLPF